MPGSSLARKQVRDTIYTLLNGNTSAGNSVFKSRCNKAFGEELPAIFIYTERDTPKLSRLMEQDFNRTLIVNVEVIVDQKDETDIIEDTADIIAGEIEDILLPNVFLQNPPPGDFADPAAGAKIVNYIQITDTQMGKADDIKEDAYGLVLQFTCEYFYCKETMAFEKDFDRFQHDYKVEGSTPDTVPMTSLTEIP